MCYSFYFSKSEAMWNCPDKSKAGMSVKELVQTTRYLIEVNDFDIDHVPEKKIKKKFQKILDSPVELNRRYCIFHVHMKERRAVYIYIKWCVHEYGQGHLTCWIPNSERHKKLLVRALDERYGR